MTISLEQLQSRIDFLNLHQVSAVDTMVRTYKAYGLAAQSLFKAINIFNKFIANFIDLMRLTPENTLVRVIKDSDSLVLIGLVCLSLAAKFEERAVFSIAEMAKAAGISSGQSADPLRLKRLELRLLQVVNFQLGTELSVQDFIQNSMIRNKAIQSLTPALQQFLKELSLYVALTASVFCSRVFSIADIAAASLYMGVKLMEKKSKGSFKIMTRALFEAILRATEGAEQNEVLLCSARLLKIISYSQSLFCNCPTLLAEHLKVRALLA